MKQERTGCVVVETSDETRDLRMSVDQAKRHKMWPDVGMGVREVGIERASKEEKGKDEQGKIDRYDSLMSHTQRAHVLMMASMVN